MSALPHALAVSEILPVGQKYPAVHGAVQLLLRPASAEYVPALHRYRTPAKQKEPANINSMRPKSARYSNKVERHLLAILLVQYLARTALLRY